MVDANAPMLSLFPFDSSVKKATKERQITTVLSWQNIQPPQLLSTTFGSGIGDVGTFYLTAEDQIIRAFLRFALRGKEEGIDFYSASDCQGVLESLRALADDKIVAGPSNVLLHLLFPTGYEPIASNKHKHAIVAHYTGQKDGHVDIDKALREIRAANEDRLGKDYKYYSPSIRTEWDANLKPNVVLQPCGNEEAYKNYQASIEHSVRVDDILARLQPSDANVARRLQDYSEVAVWAVNNSDRNRNIWKNLKPGDVALFGRRNELFSSGVILDKVESPDLGERLWGSRNWSLLYFLTDIRPQHLSYVEFNKRLGYEATYVIRDFRILDSKQSQTVLGALDMGSGVELVIEPPPISTDPVGELAQMLFWDHDRAERLWELANSTAGHQLIFMGPPGPGKRTSPLR